MIVLFLLFFQLNFMIIIIHLFKKINQNKADGIVNEYILNMSHYCSTDAQINIACRNQIIDT